MHIAAKSIAIAAAVLVGAAATHPSHAESNKGTTLTEQRPVGAFSTIELDGPVRVVVHAQGKPMLELSGERKQLDEVETVVRGDTLVVRPVSRIGFHFGFHVRPEVTVNITAAALRSLKMSGSGDVELDQLGGDRFTLASTGPGELHAAGAVRELVVSSSGSGDLDLHQVAAANVNITMSGPGDARLAGIGNELAASVSGSGDLVADGLHVARVGVRMSGPGGVKLAGSGGELRVEIGGSGDLDAAGLDARKAVIKGHGPGEVALATVSDTLDADLSGSGGLTAAMRGKRLRLKLSGPGDAHITGSVDEASVQVSGSGSLSGRELQAGRADLHVRGPGNATVRLASSGANVLVVDRSGSHRSAE